VTSDLDAFRVLHLLAYDRVYGATASAIAVTAAMKQTAVSIRLFGTRSVSMF
jgi:uncharacterized membrane protein